MLVFLCCAKASANTDISPLITFCWGISRKIVFICIWFSASFLYNAVHAVTWASCYDISHIKECQTPAFLQGFIIRFYYKSPTLETLNLVIHVLFNDSFFFWGFQLENPPKKTNQKGLTWQCWLQQKLMMYHLLFTWRENEEQKPEKHPLLHHVRFRSNAHNHILSSHTI